MDHAMIHTYMHTRVCVYMYLYSRHIILKKTPSYKHIKMLCAKICGEETQMEKCSFCTGVPG